MNTLRFGCFDKIQIDRDPVVRTLTDKCYSLNEWKREQNTAHNNRQTSIAVHSYTHIDDRVFVYL